MSSQFAMYYLLADCEMVVEAIEGNFVGVIAGD